MAPSGRAAGIRPAGADGGRRMACTVCIIHALQPGCKALEEHLSQWNDRLFVQDAQNPPPPGKRKTAARAGWAAALPSRAGRVNDKKVNEENGKRKTASRPRPKAARLRQRNPLCAGVNAQAAKGVKEGTPEQDRYVVSNKSCWIQNTTFPAGMQALF